MDFFGPVPVYDENTIVAEDFMNMLEPRKSLEEVRKFIIDDLDNDDTSCLQNGMRPMPVELPRLLPCR